jgi:integrase
LNEGWLKRALGAALKRDRSIAAQQVSVEAAIAVEEGKVRQTIHRLYITAGLLALLSYLPERRGDIVNLVIGKSVVRDAFGWSLRKKSNKTGAVRDTCNLPETLTPYLDDLVLLGADPGVRSENLMVMIDQRVQIQSPLFARIDLIRPYSGTRLFEFVKDKTGHGPHAFRKAATDDLIALDASKGQIMEHLGHSNPETSRKYYEGLGPRIRREAAGKKLSVARNETSSKIVTSTGRSFDLKAINESLRRASMK